jgi:hypothetical protein
VADADWKPWNSLFAHITVESLVHEHQIGYYQALQDSPAGQEKYTEIPWREVIGTHNRLVHGYDSVDLAILWRYDRTRSASTHLST